MIVAVLASALFLTAYALDLGVVVSSSCFWRPWAPWRSPRPKGGAFSWLRVAAAKHRQVLMLGAVAVAFLFPFTQNGSDANMSIATQVIIFATTALGLNIVVGLAGLLDLGYIAFLGAGAYVAAMMSGAATATIGWTPPFLVVALIGMCVGHPGPDHRLADPSGVGRLPGHRHLGVR